MSSSSPPLLSGKSSPCPSYSGKSSPCPTIEENDVNRSSRKKLLDLITGSSATSAGDGLPPKGPKLSLGYVETGLVKPPKSPRIHLREPLISSNENKQPLANMENIVEPKVQLENYVIDSGNNDEQHLQVVKCDQSCQTDLEDENLTLEQWREKYEKSQVTAVVVEVSTEPTVASAALEFTTNQLNTMETEFLSKATELSKAVNEPKKITSQNVATAVPKYSSVLNRSAAAIPLTTR